jgi:hypothetical protein
MIDELAIPLIIILVGFLVPISLMVRRDRLRFKYYLPQWQHPLSVIIIYFWFSLTSAACTRLQALSGMATSFAGVFIMSINVCGASWLGLQLRSTVTQQPKKIPMK